MGKKDSARERIEKDELTNEQLENVIGGMSTERFIQWRAEVINARKVSNRIL
jgi:bacteriocin-like protein